MKPISLKTKCLVVAPVFAVAIALRIRIVESGLFYDDGMIVLRVAANIARGYGFGYNVGEHVQSATSLLWSLLAALTWKISPESTFFVMRALGALADSFAAVGLSLILMSAPPSSEEETFYPAGKVISALAAGLFYATASTAALAAPSGLETGLYTCFIVFAFLALIASYVRIAVILSILLVLVRPDGVLVAVAFAAYVLANDHRSIRFAVTSYSLCGLLYVFDMYFYFHNVLPQTIIAKELFQRSAVTEWSVLIHHFFLGSAAPIGLFALLGAIEIVRHRPQLRTFLFWSVLYIVCFATFSQWWPWYLPPVVLAYAVCVGVGLELGLGYLVGAINHPEFQLPSGIAAAFLLATVSLILTLRKVPAMAEAQNLRLERGQRVASLLTRASSSTDTVMLEPLGIIGFYTPLTFYDYPGLASPRTTEVLKSLHKEVSKVPDNPEVMKVLLAKVRPNLLVLRQHEYEVDEAGKALSSCHLFATVAVPLPSDGSPDLPKMCGDCNTTMYLLRCNPSA
jgi:hypothetical protein